MTQAQKSELDKAIERAHRVGVTILARGTRKSDGARIFGVTSQRNPNHLHMVAVEGGRLVCDCPSRVICCHRGLVHEALELEAAAEKAARAAAQREMDRISAKLDHLIATVGASNAASAERQTARRDASAPAPRPAFSMWR